MVRADDLDTVALLIRAGANANATNRYGVKPISLAATNGDAAMIQTLLKAGADANSTTPEGESVLLTAARTGSVSAVEMLLTHGANVNAREGWIGRDAADVGCVGEQCCGGSGITESRGGNRRALGGAGFLPYCPSHSAAVPTARSREGGGRP